MPTENTGISVVWSLERSTRSDLVVAVTAVEEGGALLGFLEGAMATKGIG